MARNVCSCRLLLVLLVSQASNEIALAQQQQRTEISYAFMTSGGGDFVTSGVAPAIELAEEMIRANRSILAGYNLTHTAALDTQCDRTTSLNQFLESVPSSDPPVLALLGSGCSVATEPVAEIVHHWNISQISYSSMSNTLDDRVRFRNYFRTIPSLTKIVPAIRSVIELFGWKRITFLSQSDTLFSQTYSMLRMQLLPRNISIERKGIPRMTKMNMRLPPNLFVDDFRVFFINTYSDAARVIICEAAKLGLTYPRYAWLTYGWYQDRWWTEEVNPNSMVDCTDQQLATFLERALILQISPRLANSSAPTDTGLSADGFNRLYEERVRRSPFSYTFVAALAYDATWALAIALDRTMRMMDVPVMRLMRMTGCRVSGAGGGGASGLVPLEDFTYANSFMGCVIQWNLAQTNFLGVSGQLLFDKSGTRVQRGVAISQYRMNPGAEGGIERVKFGLIDATDDQFSYSGNETKITLYPDGIPSDGTPINTTVTFHLALVITYDVLAILGILFTTVCLVFNFAYRKRRIVRLTSPNLNYFILIGCYLLFLSVIARLIPTLDPRVTVASCNLQTWLCTIGYTLAFSTLLSKMIRVYRIFHNPSLKRGGLHVNDWQLTVVILSLTAVSVLLLVLSNAVPQLRPAPTLETNIENPTGQNDAGVTVNFLIIGCYEGNEFFWTIVIFAYLVLLQLIGLILAVQTRKVKIKALNDSKSVAAVIYSTGIALVLLGVATFALGPYLNYDQILLNGTLTFGTYAFLGIIFVPKMVSLYRDPLGKNVIVRTQKGDTFGPTTINVRRDSCQVELLENQIKVLERKMSTCSCIANQGVAVSNGVCEYYYPTATRDNIRRATVSTDVRIEYPQLQRSAKSPDVHLDSKDALSLSNNSSTDHLTVMKYGRGSFSVSPCTSEESLRMGSISPIVTPSLSPPTLMYVRSDAYKDDV